MAYEMNILSLSLIRPSPRKTTEGPATFSQLTPAPRGQVLGEGRDEGKMANYFFR